MKNAEKDLKDLQQMRINDYVARMKENQDGDTPIKALNEVFVDLRIINSNKDHYKRLETRIQHNMIQLKDVDKCQSVTIADLFQPDREGCSPPRRIAVYGIAGIGEYVGPICLVE